MRNLDIKKQSKRPDTPLANTPEPEYSAQYMAQQDNAAIVRQSKDNEAKKEKALKQLRDSQSSDAAKAAIVRQSKDNEAEKEKALKQLRDSQSSDAAKAAKDAQKSQSSAGAQKTNLSSLPNRR